jgi:membrane-associated phospholipid phosphatase
MIRVPHRFVLLAVIGTLITGQGAGAQAAPAPVDSAIPDHQLFHRSDLYVAAGFAVATVALLPADRHLTSVFRDEDLLNNSSAKHLASVGSFLGGPGPLIIGPAMYLVGRFGHIPRMAELAVHGTEAVVVGSGIASVIKAAAGRRRPYAVSDSNSRDFSFGRGLSNDSSKSFPSGHATAAFSAAAAVVAETSEWWPNSTWYVAPVMYGGATIVGLSRIYNDQHWASDVLMGAAIGTFSGLKVVRFNHTHSGNRLDRILLGARVVPTGNGPALAFSSAF